MQIRRRRSSFWRVWGTAVISVGALVVIGARLLEREAIEQGAPDDSRGSTGSRSGD